MTNQSTIDKLIEMRLTAMADAFRIQMDDPAYCRLLLTAVCTAIISRRYSSVTTARKNSGTVAAASTVTLPFLLLRNNFSNRVEADKDTLSDTE